ncbi:MAG: hypothetical protein OEZ43_21875 [Gammaproteobacteria bacterium]|nr:hypothetical protein [Gammaproteobacteria bacterium]
MNIRSVATIFLLAFLLGVIGCGSGEEGSEIGVVGTWNGLCEEKEGGQSSKSQLIFTEEEFSVSFLKYSVSSCSGIYQIDLEKAGTYQIGNEFVSADGVMALEFNAIEDSIYFYDLILIENDKLYTGLVDDENDGSTPEKRPKNVNFLKYWTRE